jgi:hypothetical protein
MLRLATSVLPDQQALLEVACRSPRFAGAQIDMTGLASAFTNTPTKNSAAASAV